MRRSRSRTPERQRAPSRNRRNRDRSSTPEEEEIRKHHQDRYERPDADWAKAMTHKTKKLDDGTGELRRSLNMHPIATLAKLMERIEQHARMEDDILQEDGRVVAEQTKAPVKKVDKPEPKTYRERKEYRQAKKKPEDMAAQDESGLLDLPPDGEIPRIEWG
ncbi:uncharacterized protein LOC131328398 [Rhododendron vialii]|uniref:uncharacterized protein LOC131328398 n=1 Tax=Rhododendron vialii TaxID=182163 RepID=UPI00265DB4E1|nr:uncharacterized protein LOC131328398 [Rhododendron vialii]